jgi:hypothetical protein
MSQKAYPVVIASFYFRRINKRNRRRRQIKFGRVRALRATPGQINRSFPSGGARNDTTKKQKPIFQFIFGRNRQNM